MPKRPTHSPPQGDIKSALLEARADAMRDGAEREVSQGRNAGRKPPKSRMLAILFLVTVVFGGYALIARPAWLITPPPPPESPVMLEASLRIAMWQQALYVERHREEHDTLPTDLEAVGAPVLEGVFYHRIGTDSYIITGTNGSVDLTLAAEDSLEEFVGNSLEIVANRGAE